jgi:hypothetical protein
VLAWLRDESRFHEECLLIPSEEIRTVCGPSDRDGHLKFDWHPSGDQVRVTCYAIARERLRSRSPLG